MTSLHKWNKFFLTYLHSNKEYTVMRSPQTLRSFWAIASAKN
ncbi:hypothetical protein [Nostoc sp. UHCC 0251]|nr:hypothetical protein [Nostoc sp. UHCC 0251]MEA5627656.1 hypothetical protein [Nostoc sp. UHCC 0251]